MGKDQTRRLNGMLREGIANAALSNKYAEFDKLRVIYNTAFVAAYKAGLPKLILDCMADGKARNFINMTSGASLATGEGHIITQQSRGWRGPHHPESVVDLPAPIKRIALEKIKQPERGRLEAALKDLEGKHNELSELFNRIWTLLESVNTVKRLLEVWPEAAQFIPTPPPRRSLAINTSDINKALGI